MATLFRTMIVPLEILELILLKCDGKTLLVGANVSERFKNTIEYLGKVCKLLLFLNHLFGTYSFSKVQTNVF